MFNTIQDVVKAGIWPATKPITNVKGIPELEALGFKLFYIGKNADLYFVPGLLPIGLEYRSDRVSAFNIETDIIINGKGILQTATSHKGFDFAKKIGIKTAQMPLPENIPLHIAKRCSAFELCRPLEIDIPDGRKTGLEMIKRKFLTGSIYRKFYKHNLDPYNLQIPFGLPEWTEFDDMVFTPTTKCKNDDPIDYKWVQERCPEVMEMVDLLFDESYSHLYARGYVTPDGKIEFFINSKGELVLGDEVLTPESSRYIKVSNFNQQLYIPEGKEIIRAFGEKDQWEEKGKDLKPGEKLHVLYPKEEERKVINSYEMILEAWEK